MEFDIKVGNYRLTMINSVQVKKSVENLADTAVYHRKPVITHLYVKFH